MGVYVHSGLCSSGDTKISRDLTTVGPQTQVSMGHGHTTGRSVRAQGLHTGGSRDALVSKVHSTCMGDFSRKLPCYPQRGSKVILCNHSAALTLPRTAPVYTKQMGKGRAGSDVALQNSEEGSGTSGSAQGSDTRACAGGGWGGVQTNALPRIGCSKGLDSKAGERPGPPSCPKAHHDVSY